MTGHRKIPDNRQVDFSSSNTYRAGKREVLLRFVRPSGFADGNKNIDLANSRFYSLLTTDLRRAIRITKF